MAQLLEAVIDGLDFGAIYALMAMGFVVIYKSVRVANFAVGEFILFGSGCAALGHDALGLGWPGALLGGMAGMTVFAAAFQRLVLARVEHSRPIALLMMTIGLGAFMRGAAPMLFRGHALAVPVPLPRGTISVQGALLSPSELLAGALAVAVFGAVAAAFQFSRVGLALRALADDPGAARAMGIDTRRYHPLVWALAGCIAVVVGLLWTELRGGGVGFELVGLKVFPIVIVGGLDSLAGTLLGGLLVGVLESLAATYLDPLAGASVSQVIAFAVLIAVLMARPHGLLGSPEIERV